MAHPRSARPYWSQALRSLREARGITQEGWAAQLGYGRATVKRWEAGETVPSADAESQILRLCREKALFRRFTDGPLAGVHVTPEWLSDLLASARLERGRTPSPAPIKQLPIPDIRYAHSGDVAIAYQVFGDGPIDLVVTPGMVSHRELEWEHPGFLAFFEHLASFARVIIFDKRGTGMSDRVEAGTLEERIDDIRAVMDAVGSQRAALFGISEGGPMSMLFAATYPERTQALLLYGAYACEWDPKEHPLGSPVPPIEDRTERIRGIWGTDAEGFVRIYAPSVASDPVEHDWWARYQRISASPGAAIALIKMNAAIDVRHALSVIRVPTLILHRRGDRAVSVDHGRYLARHIPGAKYFELDGSDHLPVYGDIQRLTSEVGWFLADRQSSVENESVLATVLTTNVAAPPTGNTHPEQFMAAIHHSLTRYRGRVLIVEEGCTVARFDGPSRAIRCAQAIRGAARTHGMDARSGLHTGEITIAGDEVSGTTLEVSAQISRQAAPGEILASNTVADLVPGAGFAFEERESSDIFDRWRVFTVR